MQDSDGPSTMNELMGSHQEVSLDNLHEILGGAMPEIPFDRVGRLRLVNALRNRFGDGFRNIPGVQKVMEHFDKEVETANIIKMNRRKYGNAR